MAITKETFERLRDIANGYELHASERAGSRFELATITGERLQADADIAELERLWNQKGIKIGHHVAWQHRGYVGLVVGFITDGTALLSSHWGAAPVSELRVMEDFELPTGSSSS